MSEQKSENKKKGFFAKLMEKMDKSMKEKSSKKSCCSGSKDKGSSCC